MRFFFTEIQFSLIDCSYFQKLKESVKKSLKFYFVLSKIIDYSVDTECKLNVLCTFNLGPMSTGRKLMKVQMQRENWFFSLTLLCMYFLGLRLCIEKSKKKYYSCENSKRLKVINSFCKIHYLKYLTVFWMRLSTACLEICLYHGLLSFYGLL